MTNQTPSFFLSFFHVKNKNKPGADQVGAYLRLKNIQRTTIVKFFNYHTVPKNTRKGFLRNSKTAFFLTWKHLPLEFFSIKLFGKKVTVGSLNVFLQTESFKKIQGSTLR